jgi:hypothetical protein
MIDTPFVEPGAQIESGVRQFTAIAVEPYTRRNGTPSQLVTWRGHCATCSAPYDTKGSRSGHKLALNCDQHRGRQAKHRPRAADTVSALRRLIRSAMSEMHATHYQKAYGLLEGALEISSKRRRDEAR